MRLSEKVYESGKNILSSIKENSRRIAYTGLAAVSLGAGVLSSGCLYMQDRYMSDPQNSGFLLREGGRSANSLDAAFPRNPNQAGEKLGDTLKRIPANAAETIDSVFGLAGVRPFRGRFFGKDVYQGIFNEENPESAAYMPLDKFKGNLEDHGLKYGLSHMVIAPANVLGSGVRLLRGTFIETPFHTLNYAVISRITPDTAKRAEFFSDTEDDNSGNDNLEYVVDAVTFPKDVVRGIGYCVVKHDVPSDGHKGLFYDLKNWAGVKVRDEKQREVDLKFLAFDANNRDDTRFAISAGSPVVHPVTDKLYPGVYRFNNKGELEQVAETIGDSIPSELEDDSVWYTSIKPEKAPGIIVKESSAKFHPAESVLLGIGRSLVGILYIDDSNGGDGDGGGVFGGRTGGSGGNGVIGGGNLGGGGGR